MQYADSNIKIQQKVVVFTTLLFLLKITAWVFTHSVAILTDALEYTINVIAGIVSLYSLYLSARPKDQNHPYGHGKAEFISAALEGVLMIVSSFIIVWEAVNNIWHPHTLHRLDSGIALVALTAIANYFAGAYAIKNGEKSQTLTLVATGKHMQSDTYGTIGILLGVALIYFTNWVWVDSVISIAFALLIVYSGYRILRSSLAGIMDEADEALLNEIVTFLSANRKENWIDIHNLRIIKYGSVLHLDCHLTLPWYFNIEQGHEEVKALEDMVRTNFGEHVELFIHTDSCIPPSCSICLKNDCKERKTLNNHTVEWTVHNISSNTKHGL